MLKVDDPISLTFGKMVMIEYCSNLLMKVLRLLILYLNLNSPIAIFGARIYYTFLCISRYVNFLIENFQREKTRKMINLDDR